MRIWRPQTHKTDVRFLFVRDVSCSVTERRSPQLPLQEWAPPCCCVCSESAAGGAAAGRWYPGWNARCPSLWFHFPTGAAGAGRQRAADWTDAVTQRESERQCLSAAGGQQHGIMVRYQRYPGNLRVPLCTASSRRMARARCWSWRGMLPLVLALPCTSLIPERTRSESHKNDPVSHRRYRVSNCTVVHTPEELGGSLNNFQPH